MSVIVNASGEVQWISLQRGDVFTVTQLEQVTGLAYGTKEYELAVLQVKEAIERHFLKREARDDVVVRTRDYHRLLTILTHPEQAEYTRKHSGTIKAQFRKNHRKAQAVDLGQLRNSQEKQRHVDGLWRIGAEIAALGRASRMRKPAKSKRLDGVKPPTASVPHPSAQPAVEPTVAEPVAAASV